MKYFTYVNGHEDLDRREYLQLGLYANSRLEAYSIIEKVLFKEAMEAENKRPRELGFVIDCTDERELTEGEEAVNIIYGWIPDANGDYTEKYSWEQSY